MLSEHALVDQPLVEQPRVGQHAHGHRAVDVGLKLEEQHEVEPAVVAEADAPDEVAVVADVAGGQCGQGVEVEGGAPAAGGDAVEEIADHAGLGEQLLVEASWVGGVSVMMAVGDMRAGRPVPAAAMGRRRPVSCLPS